MKNFKRLVAGTIAATMALALSVSAFAETTFTPGAENIATLTYDATNNAIGLPATVTEGENTKDNRAFMSADGQITVVLATTADANSGSLDGTKIQYINQGVKNDDFWASMGIKDALAIDTDYTLRIGTKDASSNWDVKELTFKLVNTESGKIEIVFTCGDVDGDDDCDNDDAIAILAKQIGGAVNAGGEYDIGAVIINAIICGDVDGDDDCDNDDAIAILAKQIGGAVNAGSEYDIGEIVTITE